jgi:hypothetical protein
MVKFHTIWNRVGLLYVDEFHVIVSLVQALGPAGGAAKWRVEDTPPPVDPQLVPETGQR